jgi:hypothetical protein
MFNNVDVGVAATAGRRVNGEQHQSKQYCIAHGSRSRVGFGSFVRSFTGLLGHVLAPKTWWLLGT